MANSRTDLESEFDRRLTYDEFNAAYSELKDAIYWSKQGDGCDDRTRNCLICAMDKLKSKEEYHAAQVVSDYLKFF